MFQLAVCVLLLLAFAAEIRFFQHYQKGRRTITGEPPFRVQSCLAGISVNGSHRSMQSKM
jgi:hypothetical protein